MAAAWDRVINEKMEESNWLHSLRDDQGFLILPEIDWFSSANIFNLIVCRNYFFFLAILGSNLPLIYTFPSWRNLSGMKF